MKKLKSKAGGNSTKKTFQRIIKYYGIEKDFRKLSRYAHQWWHCYHYIKEYSVPSFLVSIDPKISARPEFKGFIPGLKEELMGMEAARSPGACKLSMYEFFTVATFLGKCLQTLPYVYGPDLPDFAKRLVQAGYDMIDYEGSKCNVSTLIELIYNKFWKFNDIQNRTYWCDFGTPSGDFEIKIVEVVPERKHVLIDGRRREVIQIHHLDKVSDRVAPLEFEIIDSVTKVRRKHPVYFQMHAARQFIQRILGDVEHMSLTFYSMFSEALIRAVEAPECVTKSDGSYLVRATFHDRCFGYFLLSLVDDCFVARTFLFLTMDGTPEGDKLWEQLRLSRTDKSYLGLDKLQTFFYTDIIENQDLRKLLVDCGCGGVFDIAEDFRTNVESIRLHKVSKVATTIQDYLRPVLKEAPKTSFKKLQTSCIGQVNI
jgi:hypothetical protein